MLTTDDLDEADCLIHFGYPEDSPPVLFSLNDDCTAFLQEHTAPQERWINAPHLIGIELRSGRLEILTKLALADFKRHEYEPDARLPDWR